MELNEKEVHCIARLLQGAVFGKGVLSGCTFCKFQCKTDTDPAPHYDIILNKISEASGVDLSPAKYGLLPFSDFPYGKFLKHSDADTKEHFRNFCEKYVD